MRLIIETHAAISYLISAQRLWNIILQEYYGAKMSLSVSLSYRSEYYTLLGRSKHETLSRCWLDHSLRRRPNIKITTVQRMEKKTYNDISHEGQIKTAVFHAVEPYDPCFKSHNKALWPTFLPAMWPCILTEIPQFMLSVNHRNLGQC